MGVLSCASEAANNPWGTVIFMVIIIGMFVLMMFFNRRSQKKRQEETANMLDAIKPGNKVKTIGGICGVVVEVCDDNTFVLETGTEKSGKSYIKFDKQAVYQTDATAKKEEPVVEEKTEESVEEPIEESVEEAAEVVEETQANEEKDAE